MPEPEITGPSNTGKDPVVTMGTVSSPVIRTGIQAMLALGIIRFIEVVPNPDLVISSGDRDILMAIAVATVSLAQNLVEKLKGRRLIGSPA